MSNVRVLEFNEIIEHAVTTRYTQIFVAGGDGATVGLSAVQQLVSFYTEIERLD